MGQVLTTGLLSGAIYGLFAVGISLLYRGTRTLNFGGGEVGTFGLFLAWELIEGLHLPWLVGAVVAVVTAAAACVGFQVVILRRLPAGDRVGMAVGGIGLLSFLLASEFQVFGASPRSLSGPIAGAAFEVFGVVVSWTQVLSFVALGAVTAGLGLALRRTDFGLGVLAAAQDPEAARLVGVDVRKVTWFVWGVSGGLAAFASLLIAPAIGAFAPGFATELYVKGLVAAVVGGLANPTGAAAGGMAVGIAESAAKRIFRSATIPGLEPLTMFVIVLFALLARPGGLLVPPKTRGAA